MRMPLPSRLAQHFSRDRRRGDRVRPAGVERQVCDRLDKLFACHAILPRQREVRPELIGAIHRDQRADRHETAVSPRELRTCPHVSKKDAVSELGQLRGDVAHQLLCSRGLLAGNG